MKITIYELLGLVKDGKAPKKICFLNHYYIWKENDEDYQKEDGLMLFGNIKINYILNSEVEILEEEKKDNFTGWKMYQDGKEVCSMDFSVEEKKIPEKLDHLIGYDIQQFDDLKEYVEITTNDLFGKVNKVIDTLNQLSDYLKSKGDE